MRRNQDYFSAVTLKPKRKWMRTILFSLLSIIGSAAFVPALAQEVGNLLVTPARVVIEGRTRTASVTLANTGSAPVTYRVSFKNMRMLDDGSYENIESADAGQRFADRLIRFAPRQVTIEPGGSQVVRLLVRKPGDLPPGEYRSHILFQTVPAPSDDVGIEQNLEEGQIRVAIQIVYGVSIPVIVRQGDLSANVAISGLALQANTPEDGPVVSFRLNRTGDRSTYGDISVDYEADDGGSRIQVGIVTGLAVFTPNDGRTIRLPLNVPEGLSLRGGRLYVEYRLRPEEGDDVLASADVPVP